MSRLFEPLRLRRVTLKNRVAVSPMQTYSAKDGMADDWHFAHLSRFALGGAGLIMVEATGVLPEARSTYGDTGLWSDSQIDGFRRIVDFAHSQGCAIGIQLQHAGRKASAQRPWHGNGPLTAKDAEARNELPWQVVAATAQPFDRDWPGARAASEQDIEHIVEAYRAAARRACAANFDVVEIHAAHGYLAHTFLSPLSNDRNDDYGGDLDGRMRFLLRIVRAVREEWAADRPLFVRISAADGVGTGWSLDDSVALARLLAAADVDVVDCSSGGMKLPSSAQMVARQPGFQVPFASHVRRNAGIRTMAVGLIRDARHAEDILRNDHADLVALGREMLWNPNWPLHAAEQLDAPDHWARWPVQFGWWLQRRARGHDRSPPDRRMPPDHISRR
jgi:2,4-dienoyl-CoA reductase-like NADH-dependent reductase (Old Yellow Enzyme family)